MLFKLLRRRNDAANVRREMLFCNSGDALFFAKRKIKVRCKLFPYVKQI
jgi:hypothetical protein